jgi:hypothetical protein
MDTVQSPAPPDEVNLAPSASKANVPGLLAFCHHQSGTNLPTATPWQDSAKASWLYWLN